MSIFSNIAKKLTFDNSVLFIDATKECVKVTNNNKLSAENIENILKIFTERKEELPHISKLVSNGTIAENGYNLSVSTYVEKEDIKEKIDIKVLNQQIKEIVAHEEILRKEIDKIIADLDGGNNE